jgi:hypothetical protein
MNATRLKRLIEAHGADPQRWPPDERAAALALLASSPEAQALVAEARRLDALLAAVPVGDAAPAATVALRRRIAALPAGGEGGQPGGGAHWMLGPWSLARVWPSAAGLAAAGLIGLVVGWTQLLPAGDQPEVGDLRDLVGLTGGELQP